MYKNILNLLCQLNASVENRVNNFGAQYIPFGIFGLINYPVFYLVWKHYNFQAYENLWLRLFAALICAALLLKNYWPGKLKQWFPLYWYFLLFFCLPFFFFFMLFKNNGANAWLMSSNTVLFWLLLMVDWISYVIIFLSGVILAYIVYLLTSPEIDANIFVWWGIAAQFIASFIVVVFFARNKQCFDKEKLQTMQSITASMAHELRTPLAAITLNADGIKEFFPDLINAYQIAKMQNLIKSDIHSAQLQHLDIALDDIKEESNFAHTVINMMLVKSNQSRINSNEFTTCSIAHCVNEALRRFPFSEKERKLIVWHNNQDFSFVGNEILTVHVIFNLLKNALYYVKAAGKGEINIWLERGNHCNHLYFKDTGQGIAKNILPKIFERFFTNTRHGSGIGLAFCKMVMQTYDGNITCNSIEGEYAEFILIFPRKELLNGYKKLFKRQHHTR
jgi:signal transduction histidine kinase